MARQVNFEKFVTKVEFNKLQKQFDKLQNQFIKLKEKESSKKTRKKRIDSIHE